MHKPLTLLLILSAFCCAPCYAESVELHFDNRLWEVGYRAQNEKQGLIEYVLKGETVESWTELVSLQFFSGLQAKTTPEEFIVFTKRTIEERCPTVKWNVIRTSDTDALFEWEATNSPKIADQHEICRIIIGAEGVHIIHYATKKTPLPLDKRIEWIALLEASKIVNP